MVLSKNSDSRKEALDPIDLKIYVQVLESRQPLSVRDLARLLDIPPSTVHYHLKKLKRIGLIRDSEEGYVAVGKLALGDYIVVSRRLVPKLLIYSFFFLGVLVGQLLVVGYRREVTVDTVVSLVTALVAFLLFFIEGYKSRKKLFE